MPGARTAVLGVACALCLGAAPVSAATLTHWWKADNDFVDAIAANNGTKVGDTTFTTGVLNQAFAFDGSGDYVSVPDDPSHYPTGSFTVDLFGRTAVTSGRQMFLAVYECANSCPGGANSDIDFELLDGIAGAYVRDSDAGGPDQGGQEISGGPSFADGAFHHYVLIRDVEAAKLALYVDGIEVAEEDLHPAVAGALGNDDLEADPLTIGAYIGGGTSTPLGEVNGAVDEVKFYDGTQYPDTTPPVITPAVSGQGQNGWLLANGEVAWSVTDESILRSRQGCDAAPIASDTASQTLTCTASSAGGQSSSSITVRRDGTAPTLTCRSPAPSFTVGATGTTVTATVADDLSGASATSLSAPADTSTAGSKAVTLTGSDLAGNQGATSCAYTVVQAGPAPTKQEVALSTAPPSQVAGAFGLPSPKRCESRRRFVIHVKRPAGVTIATVKLALSGKALKVRKVAGQFAATVDLRGLHKGTYTVAIRVTTASGKTLKGKRSYHTCASRRHGSGFHAPL
jgi:hypothetical protein